MSDDDNLDGGRWYSAREAAPYLEIREDTLKKKLRSGEIVGLQKGSKRIWHVKGSEIRKVRKSWNLDI